MSENSGDNNVLKRRAIQKIAMLPTIPIALLKIIETSSDPKASAEDLQNIIMKDQAIAAAVLKLANSAYYGYMQEVDDIGRAVVVIGFKTAVSVAISVSVLKVLSDKFESQEFKKEDFWKHTIASGEAARIVAERIRYEYISRAYTIGLLHDIGKVALYFINQTGFDDAVFDARALDKPLYLSEKDTFGFDHQDAGYWLGERWQLPQTILSGIKYHHMIDECPEDSINEALLAHIANHMAKAADFGNSGDIHISELHPFVEKHCGISPEQLDSMEGELGKKRQEIDSFLESIS